MDAWEREIFEREYGDVSWYKGKQRKHTQKAEKAPKGESKLGQFLSFYVSIRILIIPGQL